MRNKELLSEANKAMALLPEKGIADRSTKNAEWPIFGVMQNKDARFECLLPIEQCLV